MFFNTTKVSLDIYSIFNLSLSWTLPRHDLQKTVSFRTFRIWDKDDANPFQEKTLSPLKNNKNSHITQYTQTNLYTNNDKAVLELFVQENKGTFVKT